MLYTHLLLLLLFSEEEEIGEVCQGMGVVRTFPFLGFTIEVIYERVNVYASLILTIFAYKNLSEFTSSLTSANFLQTPFLYCITHLVFWTDEIQYFQRRRQLYVAKKLATIFSMFTIMLAMLRVKKWRKEAMTGGRGRGRAEVE